MPDHERGAQGGGQDRFRDALLSLTTDDDVAEGNLDAALATITETAADVLGVARVNVWLFEDEQLRCVDHYDRASGAHEAGATLDASEYPTYVGALREALSLAASDARADPRTSGLTDDYLDPNGVDALLDGTLRSEGEMVGVVCHESVDGPREWTDREVEFAADVADVAHRAWRNHESARQRERLRMQRSLLEAQQEAILDGLLVVGEDGGIRSYNRNFAEMFDIPVSRLEAGGLSAVVDRIEDQLVDPGSFRETLRHLTENPFETSQREVELEDGRVLAGYSTPVVGDDGGFQGRLWTVRDVTERREVTRQLNVLHRVLRHNLSNRMSIVRGTAEQLAEDTTGTAAEAARDIVAETDKLLGVTDKHREVVRLLSDRPAPRPLAVDEVLSQAVRAVAADHPAASIRVDDAEASVVAVPSLQMALEELLDNAVEHCDAAVVEASVRVAEETVTVRVADEGPGLPEAERRILAGDQTVDPLYHGTGMGLWLVYWVVNLSGGSLAVDESAGRGTTVDVTLDREGAA